MKFKPYNQQISICLLANYFWAATLGYYLVELYGVILGVTLAYLIDRFCPRWAYELTWREIKRGIQNHYEYGCNGSRLTIRIGNRKLQIYRDNKGDPYRIGLIIRTKEWSSILGEEGVNTLYKKYGGMTISRISRHEDEILYFPDDELKDCIEILELFIQEAEGKLTSEISARTNCATRDIWAT